MPWAVGRSAACIWTLLEVWSAAPAIEMAIAAAADWCSAMVVGEDTAAPAAAAEYRDIMAGLMWAKGLVK